MAYRRFRALQIRVLAVDVSRNTPESADVEVGHAVQQGVSQIDRVRAEKLPDNSVAFMKALRRVTDEWQFRSVRRVGQIF